MRQFATQTLCRLPYSYCIQQLIGKSHGRQPGDLPISCKATRGTSRRRSSMRRSALSTLLIAVGIGLLVALPTAQAPVPVPPPAAAPASVTFAGDIEPIFAKSCWNCHSADAQLADLDLSTREAALRGGEHGAAI